jgi:AAA ATPase domain
MEQLADPGSTLLTPETLALAEGFVQVTSLGPMAVKGLPGPVEVYELAGISAVRSRLQAAAARGLSPFVGRDAETEQLRRAVDQARQGRGQVAAIVGEPGVGKSRLTFELIHSIASVAGWSSRPARHPTARRSATCP